MRRHKEFHRLVNMTAAESSLSFEHIELYMVEVSIIRVRLGQ